MLRNAVLALAAGLMLAIVPAGAATAADPAGDWTGVVKVAPVSYRIAFHLHRAADRSLAGTYDSLDRSIYDVPLADIASTRDALSFDAPSVSGRLEAKLDPATQQWVGTWSLAGQAYPVSLARGVFPPAPTVPGLDGEWDGTLSIGPRNLRLAVHIATGLHGTIATLDSLDQNIRGVSVTSVSRDGGHVRLEIKSIAASFDGVLSDRDATLSGQFAQSGAMFPLTLARLAPGASPHWAVPADWSTPSDADIRALLARRIDDGYQGVGMVVGVIDAGGRRIIGYGVRSPADRRPPNGDSVFEIGSITKSFTGLLLADMVDKGEVVLDDPVAKYLPAGATVPSHNGREITLADLATNTSGLPDNPGDASPSDSYSGYSASAAQLYALLREVRLSRDPGVAPSHSNIGSGLLGIALARRAGVDYGALVAARITGPLGMTSTALTPTADMRVRRLSGHGPYLAPAPDIALGDLAPAGALNSSANDMLNFIAAELGFRGSPLRAAMATQISAVRRPMGAGQYIGLEMIVTSPGGLVVTNGGTFGFQSFLGWDPKRRVGVVVLANVGQGGPRVTDDIGFHILNGSSVASLPAPRAPPTAISLTADALQRFVGRYDFAPQASLTITRNGERIFAQLTGQGAYEIFPRGPADFFYKAVEAEVRFVAGSDGKVTGLVLTQNGHDASAKRAP